MYRTLTHIFLLTTIALAGCSGSKSSHIVHASGPLYYTTNKTGTWQTFTVDSLASYGYQNPNIALAANGTVHLSAIRSTSEIQYITFHPSFFTGQ